MRELYDIARHLVWLTQFGLSIVAPPVLAILGALWLQGALGLGAWVVAVGAVLGIGGALAALKGSLKAIERQGAGSHEGEVDTVSFNRH